jgi:hypothetical protein
MRNRDEFLKRLHESDKFKEAMAKARTDEERTKVQAAVDAFVVSFADVLGPLIERARSDTEFVRQLGQAVVERQQVLITSDPLKSGSID